MNLQLPGRARTGRLTASLAAALLVVSLMPVAPVSVALGATTVTPATTGGSISAATAGTGGTGVYTDLAGPVITEGAPGELANNGEISPYRQGSRSTRPWAGLRRDDLWRA
jgi:hypothetical protein